MDRALGQGAMHVRAGILHRKYLIGLGTEQGQFMVTGPDQSRLLPRNIFKAGNINPVFHLTSKPLPLSVEELLSTTVTMRSTHVCFRMPDACSVNYTQLTVQPI